MFGEEDPEGQFLKHRISPTGRTRPGSATSVPPLRSGQPRSALPKPSLAMNPSSGAITWNAGVIRIARLQGQRKCELYRPIIRLGTRAANVGVIRIVRLQAQRKCESHHPITRLGTRAASDGVIRIVHLQALQKCESPRPIIRLGTRAANAGVLPKSHACLSPVARSPTARLLRGRRVHLSAAFAVPRHLPRHAEIPAVKLEGLREGTLAAIGS